MTTPTGKKGRVHHNLSVRVCKLPKRFLPSTFIYFALETKALVSTQNLMKNLNDMMLRFRPGKVFRNQSPPKDLFLNNTLHRNQ